MSVEMRCVCVVDC